MARLPSRGNQAGAVGPQGAVPSQPSAPRDTRRPAPSTTPPAVTAPTLSSLEEELSILQASTDALTQAQNNAAAAQQAATSQTQYRNNTSIRDVLAQALTGLPPDLYSSLIDVGMNAIKTLGPQATPDQIMLQVQQSAPYKTFFAGNELAIKNGYTPLSTADYLAYRNQAYALARAAGLPAGFMSDAEIAQLVGNNISPTELTDRINAAFHAGAGADAGTKQYLQQEFGVGPGGVAAFFMDPTKSVDVLQQQLTAAQIGGAGINAGFKPISRDQATQLAMAGVDQAQALSGFKQIGGELPLTEGMLGHAKGTPDTVTQAQLVGSQFFGDYKDVRAVQLAQETRKAPFQGGGGYGQTQRGTAVGQVSDVGARQPQP